ncbi:MAG TPA: twin-arginine translocase TatA/TatE family subunit [Candidatus Saccharimonadales bacterium]|nr:twin-arginine translocase TatA/TatE family subunit [Candidatus Saccharimonadales bacterium]
MFNDFALLNFSTPELVIILLIVLVLFGGKRLPELSRSLGNSVQELRKGLGEDPNANRNNNAQADRRPSDNQINQ